MGCGTVAATVAEVFDFAFFLGVACETAGAASCGLTDRTFEPARVRRGDRERTIGRASTLPRFLLPSGCIASGTTAGELGCSGAPGEKPGSSATLSSISVFRRVAGSSETGSSTTCFARF
jgi:hypothetical protein